MCKNGNYTRHFNKLCILSEKKRGNVDDPVQSCNCTDVPPETPCKRKDRMFCEVKNCMKQKQRDQK